MSLPLTPFERWISGTNQNSIPANNNSLRSEIFNTDGIADDVSAQPGSPTDGDWYIIPSGATGTQWAEFTEDSVAIFYGGTWYEFTPVAGNKVAVAGVLVIYDEVDGWQPMTIPASATWGSITGSIDDNQDLVESLDAVSIVTESAPFDITPADHSGRRRLVLAGGDVTFDSGEAYAAGQVYNIYATAQLEILTSGVTLTDVYGGTNSMSAGMAVSIVMTGAASGIVMGYVEASP